MLLAFQPKMEMRSGMLPPILYFRTHPTVDNSTSAFLHIQSSLRLLCREGDVWLRFGEFSSRRKYANYFVVVELILDYVVTPHQLNQPFNIQGTIK